MSCDYLFGEDQENAITTHHQMSQMWGVPYQHCQHYHNYQLSGCWMFRSSTLKQKHAIYRNLPNLQCGIIGMIGRDWICYMIENWRRASQNAKFLLTANADNCSYHSYRLISLILTHTDSYRLISLISAHMLVLDHHINESKHSRLLPNKAMTAMNCKKVTMN